MPVSLLQAPTWPGRRHFGNEETQANYLDVLVTAGFADPGKLATIARSWRALIALVKPDVIVADHSPGLQVACYGSGIPLVAIGTGYTLPPLEYGQFPPIRADRAPVTSEEGVLKIAAPIATESGAAPPQSLPELFRAPHRFVFSLPELDPYRAMRQEQLYLPPEPLPEFVATGPEPHLFVYLGAETPGFDEIVQALGRHPDAGQCLSAWRYRSAGGLPQAARRGGLRIAAQAGGGAAGGDPCLPRRRRDDRAGRACGGTAAARDAGFTARQSPTGACWTGWASPSG